MRWFGKQADNAAGEVVRPGALAVAFDAEICRGKLQRLLGAVAERGGADAFLAALAQKHALYRSTLAPEQVERMGREDFDALLECAFTARRRLAPALAGLTHAALVAGINALVHGPAEVTQRMSAFVDLMAKGDRNAGRAAWDLAAELLHFRDPVRYPLMTRWVWDPDTVSGALREFVRGNDLMKTIPMDGRPETFEGARAWFGQQLAALGFYRDLPFLVDLLLAQAYVDYVHAVASGLGILRADFGAKNDPTEMIVKLLGIDPARRGGRSRIKRTMH